MLFLYFQLLTTCRRRKMFQRNLTCSAPGSAEMDEERNLEDIIRSDILYSAVHSGNFSASDVEIYNDFILIS